MSTIKFAEDQQEGQDDLSMDGFDVGDGDDSLEMPIEESGEELPVPGYVPQAGDTIPSTGRQEAVSEPVEPLTDLEEDYSAVMDQVDRRMKVANYYRLILENDLFAGDETSEARLAQNRIRKYVREELEILLGMRKGGGVGTAVAAVASPFSNEEVEALKELARLAITRLKKEPQLKPIAAKPVVAAPQLKPVTAASVVPPPAPVKKPTQPAPRPVQKTPAPQQQARPQPQQVQRPQGQRDPRIPERYRDDPTAKVVNGKVFVQARNEDGELIFIVHPRTKRKIPSMKDVTPVAQPVGVIPMPMPSFAQIDQIHAAQANANIGNIQALAARNPNVAALAGAAALHLQGGPTQQQNPDEALSGDERPF